MDIILTDAGDIALVVPGNITGTNITLELFNDYVVLLQDEQPFVKVTDIEEKVINTLAKNNRLGLLSVPDMDNPPVNVTHHCDVQDKR